MYELNSEIARLEMLCEELIIYLRTADRNTAEVRVRRADLCAMLKEIERLKRKRSRLEFELELPQAA